MIKTREQKMRKAKRAMRNRRINEISMKELHNGNFITHKEHFRLHGGIPKRIKTLKWIIINYYYYE